MTATQIISGASAPQITYRQLAMAYRLHYTVLRLRKTRRWRLSMLRVEYHDVGNTVTMRLEGRFVGPFAKDARELVTRCKNPLRLVVNLSEVTFVDVVGEEVLLWLARVGGEVIAENCYRLKPVVLWNGHGVSLVHSGRSWFCCMSSTSLAWRNCLV